MEMGLLTGVEGDAALGFVAAGCTELGVVGFEDRIAHVAVDALAGGLFVGV